MDLVSDPRFTHVVAGVYLPNICCTWSREGDNTHTRYSRNSFALEEFVPKGIIRFFTPKFSLNTWLNVSNFYAGIKTTGWWYPIRIIIYHVKDWQTFETQSGSCRANSGYTLCFPFSNWQDSLGCGGTCKLL